MLCSAPKNKVAALSTHDSAFSKKLGQVPISMTEIWNLARFCVGLLTRRAVFLIHIPLFFSTERLKPGTAFFLTP
jgi:hypothetical protein